MTQTVTLKWRDVILGALVVVLLFIGALEIIKLRAALDNAKLVVTVQQNGQNIQALDQAYGGLAKRVEVLEKK